MLLRTKKKLSREISMQERIGTDQDGRELRLMDILESEPVDILDEMEQEKNILRLRECLKRVLDGRELQVICERYGLLGRKERTQREIAKELGISRSYVSRIEKRAVERLPGGVCGGRGNQLIAAKFCKMLNGKTKTLFLMSDLKPTEKYVSDAGKLKAVFGKLLSRQKLLIPCLCLARSRAVQKDGILRYANFKNRRFTQRHIHPGSFRFDCPRRYQAACGRLWSRLF